MRHLLVTGLPKFHPGTMDHVAQTELLGCKWTLSLLQALGRGHFRPSALLRQIPGLSKKVLYHRLEALMREGWVQRIQIRTYPSHVEYRLTSQGQALAQYLERLQGLSITLDMVVRVLKCKWLLGILVHLQQKSPLRTHQIQESLGTISNKMLAEALRKLESMGLVEREVALGSPIQVFYHLTPRGKALAEWCAQFGTFVAPPVSDSPALNAS